MVNYHLCFALSKCADLYYFYLLNIYHFVQLRLKLPTRTDLQRAKLNEGATLPPTPPPPGSRCCYKPLCPISVLSLSVHNVHSLQFIPVWLD